MCLDKIGRRLTAKSDITVWKYGSVVKRDFRGYALDRPEYVSPSQCHRYLFGRLCKSALKSYSFPDTLYANRTVKHPRYVLEGFHSFKNRETAIRTAKSSTHYSYVLRCTIPKGSHYYEGKFGRARSLASNRIVINEIVWERNKNWPGPK
jgi:hypothetical protein